MRKQYHFRKSPEGLLAWDVGNLIQLTKDLSAEWTSLSSIRELDEPYWYESGSDEPTCRSIAEHIRLINETDLAYPIIICPVGRVMDGMHRVVKALVEGKGQIQAYRLPQLPSPDFVGVNPDALPYDDSMIHQAGTAQRCDGFRR